MDLDCDFLCWLSCVSRTIMVRPSDALHPAEPLSCPHVARSVQTHLTGPLSQHLSVCWCNNSRDPLRLGSAGRGDKDYLVMVIHGVVSTTRSAEATSNLFASWFRALSDLLPNMLVARPMLAMNCVCFDMCQLFADHDS